MLATWSLNYKPWKKRLYLTFLERRTLLKAHALHWTSDEEHWTMGVTNVPTPGFVLPLGLAPVADQEFLSSRKFFERMSWFKGRKLILFLGRLHPKKQPDVVIRAFHSIHRDFPGTALVVAGAGNSGYVDQLQKCVRELGLEPDVSFVGMLKGREVQEALAAATLFVLPSLDENFGLAVGEAMAAGCPVVVSRQVALSKEIQEHSAGIVTEGAVDGVSRALRRLLQDEALRQTMGRNGRELVMRKFTWEQTAPQLVDVYEDILRGTRTSSAWR
jgi:glycosyltransferase involved in cell wall biosynthesis